VARLYSNENFSLPVVLELRRLGHDVLTSHDAGQANQRIPDANVVAFATSQARAVLTFNRRDFRREHQRSNRHSGIIICTVDADYVGLAGRIDAAVRSVADLTGQLISVVRPG